MRSSTHGRATGSRFSGEDRCDDVPENIGEAEVAALKLVCQTRVIDAEQMQHRGVQIVHVHGIFDGAIAKFVGGAVGACRP